MRWVESTTRIGAPLLYAKQPMLQSPTTCLLRPALQQTLTACPSCRRLSVSSPAHRDGPSFKNRPTHIPNADRFNYHPNRTRLHGRKRKQGILATSTSHSESYLEKPTLFRKLFLDDSKSGLAQTPASNRESNGFRPIRSHTEKPPPGHPAKLKRASDRGKLWVETRKERVSTDALRAWLESEVEEEEKRGGARARARMDKLSDATEKAPVVLIMFNASKSLTESDFHRLVRQNPHLKGWNTQLEKVAQAYDRNTLEPFGCYFLHFNSAAAARKFQLDAEELHNEAPKDNLDPYSTPSLRLAASPETPLRLKMYTLQPDTIARLRAFTLDGIITTAKPSDGVSGKKTAYQMSPNAPDEPHRVVLSLQHGAVEVTTLKFLLRKDGLDRNLAWDVTEILPYHASKAMMSSRMAKGLAWKSRTAAKASGDASEASELPAPEPAKSKTSDKSGRFVLFFGGEAEARRFTRMWHRRELQLPKTAEADDGTPASITVNAIMPL